MNDCPSCHEPMIALELDGIEIDHCLSCLGSWLDQGEIHLIAEKAGVDHGHVTELLENAVKGKRTKMKCPRCHTALREVILIDKENKLILDRCQRRHGIWFDQGEIKKMILEFNSGEEKALADFLGDLLGNEIKGEEDAC